MYVIHWVKIMYVLKWIQKKNVCCVDILGQAARFQGEP